MQIGVLGTGVVGRTMAGKLAGLRRGEPGGQGPRRRGIRSFGSRDIIDLGDLATARGTELLLPIWLSLMGPLGLPPSSFQFKVVR